MLLEKKAMIDSLLCIHGAGLAYLARRQRLVDVSENVGQQTICPVPGVCVQHTVELSYTESLQVKASQVTMALYVCLAQLTLLASVRRLQHGRRISCLGCTLGLRTFMVVRLPIFVWQRASVCRMTDLPPPVCPTTITVCLVISTCRAQLELQW